MLENHTLVVPTYNRPALVRRLVSYYVKTLGTPNVVVLDSSEEETAEDNAAALAVHGKSVRHSIFASDMPMALKLHHGLGQVDTPYASFCADDDVVFPQGLQKALDILEAAPQFVTAHGRYLNFKVRGARTVDVWIEYAGPGNDAKHAGARIFRLFQRYESLFYGMFRTRDLRDIFEVVQAIPTLHYQELFQSAAALIKGQVHRFPEFYAARQSIDPAEPTRQKWQTFYWFAEDPTEVIEHYRQYCAALWQFYQAHGAQPRLSGQEFYRALDLSHAVYFAKHCPEPYFYSVLQPLFPDDKYVDPGEEIPVVRRLVSWIYRNRGLTRFLKEGYDGLQFRAGARMPHVRSLNREVRQICRTPWVGRLRYEYRDLAQEPNFRATYLQLCRYLDVTDSFLVSRSRKATGEVTKDGAILFADKRYPIVTRVAGALEGVEPIPYGYRIRGWAADHLANAPVKTLLAVQGTKVLARSNPFIERRDIEDVVAPGARPAGFELDLTPGGAGAGEIAVYALMADDVAVALASSLSERSKLPLSNVPFPTGR